MRKVETVWRRNLKEEKRGAMPDIEWNIPSRVMDELSTTLVRKNTQTRHHEGLGEVVRP